MCENMHLCKQKTNILTFYLLFTYSPSTVAAGTVKMQIYFTERMHMSEKECLSLYTNLSKRCCSNQANENLFHIM